MPPVGLAAVALLVGLAGLAGLAGCAGGTQGSGVAGAPGRVALHGTPLHNGVRLPSESFTDTRGAAYVPASDGTSVPVTLVFFGYSHCPDLCNVVLADVASALRGASPGVRARVRMVFVTTDPSRDTPAVVGGYLRRFDPSFVGLTASLPTIRRAMDDLHIAYAGIRRTSGGGYEVAHGTQLIGFVAGRGRVVWDQRTTVAELRSDLIRLVTAARR